MRSTYSRGPRMSLSDAETAAAQKLVTLALIEDLGSAGDVTSAATIPAELPGRAAVVARAAGVIAGLPVAALVCDAVDPALTLVHIVADGTTVSPGAELATLAGPMRS